MKNEITAKRAFSMAGFLALIVILVKFVICDYLFPFVLFPGGDNLYIILLLPLILTYVILIPALWPFVKRSSNPELFPQKHSIPAKKLFTWFLVMFAVTRIIAVATTLIHNAIAGEPAEDPVALLQKQAPWLMFFLAVLVAPIAEEILFRGFLFKLLAPYGGKFYILVSGLLFSLFHININQIPFAFVTGVFLAYLMYRTGDIRIPIFIHFVTNLISSAGVFFLGSDAGTNAVGVVMLALMVVGIIVLIVLLANRRLKQDIVFEPAAATATAGQVWGNAGMTLFIIVAIIMTVYSKLFMMGLISFT